MKARKARCSFVRVENKMEIVNRLIQRLSLVLFDEKWKACWVFHLVIKIQRIFQPDFKNVWVLYEIPRNPIADLQGDSF